MAMSFAKKTGCAFLILLVLLLFLVFGTLVYKSYLGMTAQAMYEDMRRDGLVYTRAELVEKYPEPTPEMREVYGLLDSAVKRYHMMSDSPVLSADLRHALSQFLQCKDWRPFFGFKEALVPDQGLTIQTLHPVLNLCLSDFVTACDSRDFPDIRVAYADVEALARITRGVPSIVSYLFLSNANAVVTARVTDLLRADSQCFSTDDIMAFRTFARENAACYRALIIEDEKINNTFRLELLGPKNGFSVRFLDGVDSPSWIKYGPELFMYFVNVHDYMAVMEFSRKFILRIQTHQEDGPLSPTDVNFPTYGVISKLMIPCYANLAIVESENTAREFSAFLDSVLECRSHVK